MYNTDTILDLCYFTMKDHIHKTDEILVIIQLLHKNSLSRQTTKKL